MVKKCAQNKIKNPRTKRCVNKDGAIGRKLQGKAKKYMDTPALRKAIAKEKAKGKKAFSIPKRTKLLVGELRDKLVKNGYSRSVVTRMRKADLEKLPPKPTAKKPKPKARKPKETFYKVKSWEVEDKMLDEAPVKNIYENEFEGYLEENQRDNMTEKQQGKLMDKASGHAFRWIRKAFNRVKKRKFKTRNEFIEAVAKEAE
jgi:hypothetical protein